MTSAMNPSEEVRQVLQRFQDYYTRRDPALLENFLEMLADEELEVIGTNGVRPGEGEWYLGKQAAREIFLGDWEFWGDLRLDVPGARIRLHDRIAWLSTTGTVSKRIQAEEGAADFLARVRQILDNERAPAQEQLLYLLRGGSNTLYELHRGEDFTWPMRFTAVLALHEMDWKFQHMQFSFPTVYFPDVRIFSPGGE